MVAIETSGADGTYAWDLIAGANGFERVTLFAHADAQKQPAREVSRRMVAALDKLHPRVVVVPGWADAAALAALQWCAHNRVPAVIMSESTAWDAQRRAWSEELKRRIVGLGSAALVGGTPHKEYIIQLGMPAERVFQGYDAVDNDYFAAGAAKIRGQSSGLRSPGSQHPASSIQHPAPVSGLSPQVSGFRSPPSALCHLPSSPFFLASARFVEKKNLPRLIQAYARYRELAQKSEAGNPLPAPSIQHPAASCQLPAPVSGLRSPPSALWSLVLLGDGELRSSIFDLRSSLGLDAHVHLPGFKQYPDLPAYYAGAGAFIHASTTEQWGLVVNEAMASGLPVLVSNRCGCARDLVQDGINGFIFDPYNIEEMANRMFQVSGLKSQLSEFGSASARLIANWGPDRFAAGLNAAVECALRSGPMKPALLQRMILQALLWK